MEVNRENKENGIELFQSMRHLIAVISEMRLKLATESLAVL